MSTEEKGGLFFKVALAGKYGVGKSSLLLRYVDGEFQDESQRTLVDYKIKNLTVNEQPVKLKICDTAGQERFRTITAGFYRGINGVIFAFDVTDQDSFETLNHWIDEAKRYAPENAQKLIVATKNDLTEKRVVKKEDIENFCKKEGLTYVETSSKSGEGVETVFQKLTEAIMKQKDSAPSPKVEGIKKKSTCQLV